MEGNGAKAFGKDEVTGDDLELPLLQLLRDVEIRWSSTFLMIDRVLFLNPVSDSHRIHSSILTADLFTFSR